jgi:hypothetical protein
MVSNVIPKIEEHDTSFSMISEKMTCDYDELIQINKCNFTPNLHVKQGFTTKLKGL